MAVSRKSKAPGTDKGHSSTLSTIFTILLTAVLTALITTPLGMFAGYLTILAHVDRRIDEKVSNPSFVKELGSAVRPYAIFDYNGSILLDRGAQRYIKLQVISQTMSSTTPREAVVLVEPNQYLEYPPMISSIGPHFYAVSVTRAENFSFRYNLKWLNRFGDEDEPPRFFIEVVP